MIYFSEIPRIFLEEQKMIYHGYFKNMEVFSAGKLFGIPRVMGAFEPLGCNWWSNMHQIDD